MNSKVWVNLNTYNESENIADIIKAILHVPLPDMTLCVVDDNSPDGTGQIAEGLKPQYANLEVIHRPEKQGVGPAYQSGFGLGLSLGADYYIQIDADFSHDPMDILKLLKAAETARVVTGSRYVAGGGVEAVPWWRDLISRWGNYYIKSKLDLPVLDVTSGYMLYHRMVLERIGLATMASKGYAWQIEMKTRARRLGFTFAEVPIIFHKRIRNKSKFKMEIIWECLYQVKRLRHESN